MTEELYTKLIYYHLFGSICSLLISVGMFLYMITSIFTRGNKKMYSSEYSTSDEYD